jgi:hypothetical protein
MSVSLVIFADRTYLGPEAGMKWSQDYAGCGGSLLKS